MFKKYPWFLPALAGGVGGFVNGLLGGGGGMVLVPMFTGPCRLDTRTALATSVAVIFPLCLLSSLLYFLQGGLDLAAAFPYLLGGLAGGLLGGRLFPRLPLPLLKKGFALLLLFGGIRSLVQVWAAF